MNTERKFTIYLHGKLGKKYGKGAITLWAISLKDVVAGLCANYGEGFKETIRNGNWHITQGQGSNRPKQTDKFLSIEEFEMPVFNDVINFYPEVKGAMGKPGMMGIIMGVLMIAAIFLLPAVGVALAAGTAQMLAVGGAIAILGGIATMVMTKTPKMGDYGKQEDKKKSFVYNGPINAMEQGGPVPLIYGIHLTGSTVISSAIAVKDIPVGV